jgi:hypothetical protein
MPASGGWPIYFAFVMGQYALTFWLPSLVKATGVSGNFTSACSAPSPSVRHRRHEPVRPQRRPRASAAGT